MHPRLTALLLLSACHHVFDIDGGNDAPPRERWSAPVAEQIELAFSDDSVSLTADRLTLFFARVDKDGVLDDGQIYTATREAPHARFSTPAIVAELSKAGFQRTPRVLPDGLTMLYQFAELATTGDLYVATRPGPGEEWDRGSAISGINSIAYDAHGTMNAARTMLVFASDRAGGAGGMDLYYTSRAAPDRDWMPPVPIVNLNTVAEESGAWLSQDGLALYFYREVGGHTDIFVSRRASPEVPFEPAEPVREINSNDYEVDPWLSPDGRYLYFVRHDIRRDKTTMLMYATRE